MKLKDLKDVLTFAAFRPEPDDGSASWPRRFPTKKTLLLNVGKNHTTWKMLGKGRFFDGGTQKGDFKEIVAAMAPEWLKMIDDGWCNVSINSRYVISLESNLPRKEGVEDSMRTNPRATLGSKFERGKRYALTNNPEQATSILLSCDEEVIKKIEGILTEAGLNVGRICCGTYTMLRRAIEYANDGSRPPTARPPNFIYVVCCDGSICLLTQAGDVWSDLRSRADFYEEDTTPVLELISPSRDGGDTQVEILFTCDKEGSDLPEKLAERFRGVKITDLTGPDHLWATISELHS